jgi:hypothetical protein
MTERWDKKAPAHAEAFPWLIKKIYFSVLNQSSTSL